MGQNDDLAKYLCILYLLCTISNVYTNSNVVNAIWGKMWFLIGVLILIMSILLCIRAHALGLSIKEPAKNQKWFRLVSSSHFSDWAETGQSINTEIQLAKKISVRIDEKVWMKIWQKKEGVVLMLIETVFVFILNKYYRGCMRYTVN